MDNHYTKGNFMTKAILIPALVLTLAPGILHAQCSDAGACSVGSGHERAGHSIGVSYLFGKSGKTDDLTFHTLQLEASIRVLDEANITLLLPWSSIKGPLGSTSGLGDIILLWNHTLHHGEDGTLGVHVGGKFATGESNAAGLPQAYQPGLGTNDLLAGVSYETDVMAFGLAYQHSNGRSRNEMTRLKRGSDLVARGGYKTTVHDLGVVLELLAIKRLEESSVAGSGDSFITVPGSDQLQVNLAARLSYQLSDDVGLRGLVAIPLRNREVNVDGLTRAAGLSLGLSVGF